MKKTFTSLIALVVLLLCAIVFAVPRMPDALVAQSDMQKVRAPIMRENLSSIGLIKLSDYDGSVFLRFETSARSNKNGILPMATVERKSNLYHTKLETRESVSNFTEREFYDLPPNDFGYNGISFANRIRASPQSA